MLRPDGALAIWTCGLASVSPQIDALVQDFYSRVVGPYWPPERRYVEAAYRTLPFPMREFAAPPFKLKLQWDLDALMGYISTWSAVQRYTKARRTDPLPALRLLLAPHWNPASELRSVVWPLHLRVGRP